MQRKNKTEQSQSNQQPKYKQKSKHTNIKRQKAQRKVIHTHKSIQSTTIQIQAFGIVQHCGVGWPAPPLGLACSGSVVCEYVVVKSISGSCWCGWSEEVHHRKPNHKDIDSSINKQMNQSIRTAATTKHDEDEE